MLPLDKNVTLIRGRAKTSNNQLTKAAIKNHQLQKIFQDIADELTILAATAKYNHTTCKTDTNQLNLTLAYIHDTEKLAEVLKNRINLLNQATG